MGPWYVPRSHFALDMSQIWFCKGDLIQWTVFKARSDENDIIPAITIALSILAGLLLLIDQIRRLRGAGADEAGGSGLCGTDERRL